MNVYRLNNIIPFPLERRIPEKPEEARKAEAAIIILPVLRVGWERNVEPPCDV